MQTDLARIFSMPPDERQALFQSLQHNMQHNMQQPAPHNPANPLPISSSSKNSSGNLPDPFASLGLNSGDWLGHMLGAGMGSSLQGVLPDAFVPPVAPGQPTHETLARLPAKAIPPLPGSHAPSATLGTSAAGRVRRKSARAAAASDEETPFADFVPVTSEAKVTAGSTDDGAAHAVTGVRRKATEVDWRTVSDPEERKRLRRMAKNRRTAAASRERKKAALDNLNAECDSLKAQVAVLEQHLAQERVARTAAEAEIARLRGLLTADGANHT